MCSPSGVLGVLSLTGVLRADRDAQRQRSNNGFVSPLSDGISSPPWTTFHFARRGMEARTCAVSTASGLGTPMITSNTSESTCQAEARVTLSELATVASRRARTEISYNRHTNVVPCPSTVTTRSMPGLGYSLALPVYYVLDVFSVTDMGRTRVRSDRDDAVSAQQFQHLLQCSGGWHRLEVKRRRMSAKPTAPPAHPQSENENRDAPSASPYRHDRRQSCRHGRSVTPAKADQGCSSISQSMPPHRPARGRVEASVHEQLSGLDRKAGNASLKIATGDR